MYTTNLRKDVQKKDTTRKDYNREIKANFDELLARLRKTIGTIPDPQVQADWNQVSPFQIDFIKNKPSLSGIVTQVSDKTFNLNISSGELTVEPYVGKKLSDPGYAYFYEGGFNPTFTNRLQLDGVLHATSIVINGLYGDAEFFSNGYNINFNNGVDLFNTVILLSDGAGESRYLAEAIMLNGIGNRSVPIRIGSASSSLNRHGENILIDDYNRIFDINFTDIKLSKGTPSKWLALDADKKIIYLDTPTMSESDPIYTASSWYTTTNNSSNWNTAYSWGDHSVAGYAASGHTHTGVYEPILGNPAVDGYVLSSSAAGVRSWIAASGGGISGLTANYIPKASSATTITNSSIYTTGTKLALNYTAAAPALSHVLEVNFGHIKFNPIANPIQGSWAAALAGAGAGNVDNGTHYYYVKYVGEYGVTGYGGSAEVSVVVTDKTTNGKVTLSNIPIAPAGSGVTGRKLYRTINGTRYFGYYLATINDNTTTSYTDNIASGSLNQADAYYTSPNSTSGKMYSGIYQIFYVEQYSTILGYRAGEAITTGGANTLIGSQAGTALTSGTSNVFVGGGSVGQSITTGGYNVAVGSSALRGATATTSCVAIGSSALQFCSATGNTSIGSNSSYMITTGSYNVMLGHSCGNYGLQKVNVNYSSALGLGAYTYKNYQTMIGSMFNYQLQDAEVLVNGNTYIRNETSLGTEVLTNPNLTAGTSWSRTNDCALSSDKATWTFSTGSASTLTQTSATFAVPAIGNRWYKFVYTVSGVTGTIAHHIGSITTSFASEVTPLYVSANGTYYVYFRSNSAPSNFVITFTLTTGQSFTLDTFSLKEVIGGDLMAGRDLAATRKVVVNEKGAINEYGGFMVKLTNKTGGNSVKGEVVMASHTTANAVSKIVVDEPDPIGVFYESGIADGSEAWIVVSGIADVYFIGDTSLGYYARGFMTGDAGYVTGQALAEALPTPPFASDKHFYEIGHVLESRTGAGLAKCVLHFN